MKNLKALKLAGRHFNKDHLLLFFINNENKTIIVIIALIIM